MRLLISFLSGLIHFVYRLGDRPSKLYVSDALEAFKDFCEKQSSLAHKAAKAKSRAKTASTSRTPMLSSLSSVA